MEKRVEDDELEFKWGKKRGIGGKKKDVQFYESFTFDGVQYTLYDCVYLYKDGEPEPFIGKLIKIWEHPDKTKKVKVLWFFRPDDIGEHLVNDQIMENELFLACGEGPGLANINPLEAIAGKCNVACISKDNRNPQLSTEELQMSDFVFSRTFDVSLCKISDKIDDKIAGIEVKFLFNRVDQKNSHGALKLVSKKNEDCVNVVASGLGANSSKDIVKEVETGKRVDNSTNVSPKEMVKVVSGGQESEPLKPVSRMNIESDKCAKTDGGEQENVSADKTMRSKVTENAHMKTVGDCNHTKRENGSSKIVVGSNEVADSKYKVEKNSSGKTSLQSKNEEMLVSKTVLHGQVSSPKEVTPQVAGLSSEKLKTDNKLGKVSIDKIGSSCKAYSEKKMGKGAQVPIRKLEVKEQLKSKKDTSALDNRPSKRSKHDDGSPTAFDDDSKTNLQDLGHVSNRNHVKIVKQSHGHKECSKRLKDDANVIKSSIGNISKQSAIQVSDKETNYEVLEVTRRPNVGDRSSWFKEVDWDKRIPDAFNQGKLVLLENLDPSCTSTEVEDIIWHAFKEFCSAKMVQQNAISSPHSGQAYVIFKTREAAEMVVKKLEEDCLMLSHGRPLVASFRAPCFSKKQSAYTGHFVLDRLKSFLSRDVREALSTSHFSQPNTLEYDMAMEWIVQQKKSDRQWKDLYREQGKELRKLQAKLKWK